MQNSQTEKYKTVLPMDTYVASKAHYKAKERTDSISLDSAFSGEKELVLWRGLWDPGAEGSVNLCPIPDHQQ